MSETKKVYQAINAVQTAISKTGISKDHKNQQQNYSFRGIDDVYNALCPLLAEAKLTIIPRVVAREVVERVSNNNKTLFYVTVEVEFDFVCAEDASLHTGKAFGEAMDSGDKATNKAMSAAYKYICMQTFAIPTEGDNDADASTHELQTTVDALVEKAKDAVEREDWYLLCCLDRRSDNEWLSAWGKLHQHKGRIKEIIDKRTEYKNSLIRLAENEDLTGFTQIVDELKTPEARYIYTLLDGEEKAQKLMVPLIQKREDAKKEAA